MATKKLKVQSPIRVGNKVLVRAVTHYYTGEIVLITRDEIVLRSAAWVADTGRYSTALSSGMLGEYEGYPDAALVTVGRGAVVDVADWLHALPRGQK